MSRKYILFLICSLVIGTCTWRPPSVAAAASTYIHEGGPSVSHTNVDNAPATIIIFISGSTNICPSTLYIHATSTIIAASCRPVQPQILPLELTKTLFNDVYIAQPLNALPKNHDCIKSISFRTTTTIVFRTQKSPDISCSADVLGKRLYEDVIAIKQCIQTLPASGFFVDYDRKAP